LLRIRWGVLWFRRGYEFSVSVGAGNLWRGWGQSCLRAVWNVPYGSSVQHIVWRPGRLGGRAAIPAALGRRSSCFSDVHVPVLTPFSSVRNLALAPPAPSQKQLRIRVAKRAETSMMRLFNSFFISKAWIILT
jgi:hypothetical protein